MKCVSRALARGFDGGPISPTAPPTLIIATTQNSLGYFDLTRLACFPTPHPQRCVVYTGSGNGVVKNNLIYVCLFVVVVRWVVVEIGNGEGGKS